jgi:two-component system response regulator QseB
MLPERDGFAVLKTLRERGVDTPVLVLTARDAVTDRVAGLDLGADDYLTKPFALDEFLTRVRTLLRRGSGQTVPLLRVANLTLNPATREVARAAWWNGAGDRRRPRPSLTPGPRAAEPT